MVGIMQKLLKDYWQVVTFILLLVWSSAMAYGKLNDHERRITTIEEAMAVLGSIDANVKSLLNKR